ncbi:MAG: FeoC-like transcriptional regulator, partial [Sutterella wadsworthensis]|nr:FeoC-like transcriptional regulator [Sutterella wadsworthensis]
MLSVSEIRTLIKERPGISLRDLALHFRVSPGMMEMMVSKLVDRGDVETVVPTSCCGG